MGRWLRKASGDMTPWPWTPALATRKDMIEISESDARRLRGLLAEPETALSAGDAPKVLPSAESVLLITDKDELEALGREHGTELDKRRALKTMQTDLIKALDLR